MNTTSEYFLGDALGSVRQMTDPASEITFTQSYDPYGVVTSTSGESHTEYGYTGEQYGDYIQLLYLRARYYNPADGRFQSRDTWGGDVNSPLSLNRWMYVEGNPVNYNDPTGLIAQNEAADANQIVHELKIYRVFVKVDWGGQNWYNDPIDPNNFGAGCSWYPGEWTLWELQELRKGVTDTSRAMGGLNAFIFNYNYINVEKRLPKAITAQTTAKAVGGAHILVVNVNFDNLADRWTIVHELGHVWDGNNAWELSDKLVDYTNQFGTVWSKPANCGSDTKSPGCNSAGYVYADVLAGGSGKTMNPKEDFANSFVGYVYPVDTQGRIQKYFGTKYEKYLYYSDYTTTLRWKYIDALVQTTDLYRR